MRKGTNQRARNRKRKGKLVSRGARRFLDDNRPCRANLILSGPCINKKFARTDLVRLRKMLIDQVCEATGGPCTYSGRSMKAAHEGMGVTSGEFDALVQDLVATFEHFNVGKQEQGEVLAVLGPLKTDIVELDSSQVGTPLPAAYQAAPALAR